MGLPFLAQLGVASIPTAVGVAHDIINPSKPNSYEKSLARQASVYEGQAKAPVTQNRIFTEGRAMLNNQDKKNRRRAENIAGGGNVTQDAKLAVMQSGNDGMAQALAQIFSNAQRFREFSQNNFLRISGMQEQARQQRMAQHTQNKASMVQPLASAAGSFLESELLAGRKKK